MRVLVALSASLVPPSGPVAIDVISVGGGGCGAGATDVALSADSQAFVLT